MKIAIQGERGSFSDQAALQLTADAEIVPCRVSREVFESVLRREVDAMVIPLENTLAGAVVEHYDLLRDHAITIDRETVVRIQHHVIGAPGSTLADLRRVYSHPVALAQCRSFFAEHSQIEPTAFYDTAGAVRHVVEGGYKSAGALAGRRAATLFRGVILAEAVEDDAANFTRFVLARGGGRGAIPQGEHKLSLVLELPATAGSLAQLLQAIHELQGKVTQLQSRPWKGEPWRYHYFLDALLPHAAATQRLLERLPALTGCHKVLGYYQPAPECLEVHRGGW